MPLHPGQKLEQPAIKKRLKKWNIKDRLTIKEKKAADHYLDNGVKIHAIEHAYTMGTHGGSNNPRTRYINVNNMAKQVFDRKRVQDYINEQTSTAMSRVVDLSISADSDAVRLNANKDILDRGGFKPKEVSEVEVIKTYDEEQIAEDDSVTDGRNDGTEGKE